MAVTVGLCHGKRTLIVKKGRYSSFKITYYLFEKHFTVFSRLKVQYSNKEKEKKYELKIEFFEAVLIFAIYTYFKLLFSFL